MSKTIKFVLIIILTISCNSCGFKLRSKHELPAQLQQLYLQSNNPYGQLELQLKRSLEASGVHLVANKKMAPITINIISTHYSYHNPNTVTTTQSTIYNFSYQATFNLVDKNNHPLTAKQTVVTTRTLTLNANQVLDASNEADIIKQEMERDLIFKMLSILESRDTRNALAK